MALQSPRTFRQAEAAAAALSEAGSGAALVSASRARQPPRLWADLRLPASPSHPSLLRPSAAFLPARITPTTTGRLLHSVSVSSGTQRRLRPQRPSLPPFTQSITTLSRSGIATHSQRPLCHQSSSSSASSPHTARRRRCQSRRVISRFLPSSRAAALCFASASLR